MRNMKYIIEYEPMTADKARLKRYRRAMRKPLSFRQILDCTYPWICLAGSMAVFYLAAMLIVGGR